MSGHQCVPMGIVRDNAVVSASFAVGRVSFFIDMYLTSLIYWRRAVDLANQF